jgi:hypothetical protein
MTPLNLDRLQHWIDRGLIDPSQPITMKELFETRCVHGIRDGVKLLGDVSCSLSEPFETLLRAPRRSKLTSLSVAQGAENFTTPNVQIEVSKASQSAIKAIERLNGSLVERYENRLTLVRCQSLCHCGPVQCADLSYSPSNCLPAPNRPSPPPSLPLSLPSKARSHQPRLFPPPQP